MIGAEGKGRKREEGSVCARGECWLTGVGGWTEGVEWVGVGTGAEAGLAGGEVDGVLILA